jgi:hypothetical protein
MLRRILATAFAILAVGIAAPSAAQADPPTGATCGGYGCDLQDPYTTRCVNDAVTIRSAQVSSSNVVYLMYSPLCQTAWARTDAVGFWIEVVSYYLNGQHRMTVESYTQSGVRYTPMVYDGGLLAEACELLPSTGGQGWVCTTRY